MTWSWTSQFENNPIGGNFGAVTSYEIRRHKEAFEERFEKEHYLDTADAPEGYHLSGQCSVVLLDSEGTTLLVDGALQLHEFTLKRDTALALENIATANHLNLLGTTDVEADHPQYVAVNHSQGYEELNAEVDFLSTYGVSGLPSDYSTADEKAALSRGGHLGTAAGGGAKHDDDSFDLIPGDSFGLDVFDTEVATFNPTFSGGNAQVVLGEFCGFPALTAISGTTAPILWVCTDTWVDDYQGRIGLRNADNPTITLKAKRFVT